MFFRLINIIVSPSYSGELQYLLSIENGFNFTDIILRTAFFIGHSQTWMFLHGNEHVIIILSDIIYL